MQAGLSPSFPLLGLCLCCWWMLGADLNGVWWPLSFCVTVCLSHSGSLSLSLQDQAAKDKALQSMATMSSAQIISPTAFQNKMALQGLSRPAYPTTGGVSPWPLSPPPQYLDELRAVVRFIKLSKLGHPQKCVRVSFNATWHYYTTTV